MGNVAWWICVIVAFLVVLTLVEVFRLHTRVRRLERHAQYVRAHLDAVDRASTAVQLAATSASSLPDITAAMARLAAASPAKLSSSIWMRRSGR